MIVHISEEAEADLADGFWFYDVKEPGLGSEFRDSMKLDIRSLEKTGGSHNIRHGYHRKLCKRFPCSIFYRLDSESSLTVVAVFGQRRGEKWISERLKNAR